MATTTTNFGWDIPQSTDLVKDGATAIAALGQDIDTALVDLKGGTTGQVLAKASNTDLDYSWVAVDPLLILDAKGDLITATAADTPARLAVGANGTVLTADSAQGTGLRWATPSSGAVVQVVSASASTAVATSSNVYADITGLTATITPTSASNKILVLVTIGSVFKQTNDTSAGFKLFRGATEIALQDTLGYTGSTAMTIFSVPINRLDSPATTSATTYKVQFRSTSNNGTITAQFGSPTNASSITLMEVKP
jgi:hypothetical protein